MIMHGNDKEDRYRRDRERMVRLHLRGRGIVDPRVLSAMERVPREAFVPEQYASQAYADGPLPIGDGQTISQPYIVALMSQELRVEPRDRVLELGTGSGYQTAVLSKMADRVYTIERIAELSERARGILERIGVSNVEYYVGDGSQGWPAERMPEGGCFERIMITAAVPEIPGPVADQLAEGGVLVAPTGGRTSQRLMVYEKENGRLVQHFVCDVRFVRLLGEHGFGT